MKRSPRSHNLQALQGNEPQFKPIAPARRTSLTKASTSSTHASNEPTPHWQEQLQPVVQFRTHYKFGSHQPPVEINFNQGGIVQPTQILDTTHQRKKTDGGADKNYPPPSNELHYELLQRKSSQNQVTTEEQEQSETDGKPMRSGTATRSEANYRQLYQGAHDCVPCHNGPRHATSSRQSRDSSSDDDGKPSLRRQHAIRRRRSPTPARPKSQSVRSLEQTTRATHRTGSRRSNIGAQHETNVRSKQVHTVCPTTKAST
jgi:hypothetical protein